VTSALLQAENISAQRSGRVVLESCSLSVEPGERIAIYGPNGAGKSTMLQTLAGLLPIASGLISFRGKAVGREVSLLEFHRRTAAVFQEPLLLRGTVRHNVELGLKLRGVAAPERAARVQTWLDHLHIAHLSDRPIAALSGGEAQRTSLARALVLDPEVFFLDEPFAALDAPTRTRLADELSEILDERQIATLFVTHDIDEAAALCDHCVVLDAGRVLQQDNMATVLARPTSRRVAEIIGVSNVFEARVVDAGPGGTWLEWSGRRIHTIARARVGECVAFLIQQEQIRLQAAGAEAINRVRGRVCDDRRRGRRRSISVCVGNLHRIEVPADLSDCTRPGAEVTVLFPPDAIWIFPERSENLVEPQTGFVRTRSLDPRSL
jgi:tungstate transport system ATP-binding protein